MGGKIKVTKECRSCRGKDDLRVEEGKSGEDPTASFDPARVQDSVEDIASKLNPEGKKCIKRIVAATSKLKAQIQQWRKDDPDQDVESEAENENKQLAEVQAEIDETAEDSEALENEFEDDDVGKNFREKADTLKEMISDANTPENCKDEFEALKSDFNEIIEEYKGLPAKLKGEGVERAQFKFSDTDIGTTNLTSSKNICKFAGLLVSKMKKAAGNHKTRLESARKLLCIKGGRMLKNKRVSKLFNCLRMAKRKADAGSDDSLKQKVNTEINKVDSNTFLRVKKLLGLMKKKCLIKDTQDSQPARVRALFKEMLKRKIKKQKGDAFTESDKSQIAEKSNAAVKSKFPDAINVVTNIKETSSRRQLRPRRSLAAALDVETTWELETVSKVSDQVVVNLGDDFVVTDSQLSAQSTDGTIQGTDPVAPIDDELPDGTGGTGGETTTGAAQSTTTAAPDEDNEATSVGAKEVAFGTASAICTALWLF